ncbi:hypothetical protein POUND7_013061 [Theobroma cacao]
MDDYDMIGNLRDLIEGECVARRTMMHQLWTTSRQKESLWLQKSKIQWLKEGDKNTHFFQCTAKARSRRNLIASVMVYGYWVFKLNGIHNTVYDYFRNLFNITQWSQPVFQELHFKKLSLYDAFNLKAPPFVDELKDIVWSCDGFKALDLDSFNLNFYKKNWVMVKHDLFVMIVDFMITGKLEKDLHGSHS